ncbi:MAG: type II 3-dehydroquinate dehydratase [Thermoleophilia bacterium]
MKALVGPDHAPDRVGGDGRPLLVLLHGVNLGLLGERPAAHYGTVTLADLERLVTKEAEKSGWECACHQTDHEGVYVELIHGYRNSAAAVIVNPGAWTHYSYAIRDALELVKCPVAEVHLSDVERREEWRRVSVVADVASIRIVGKGPEGYAQAVRELVGLVTGVRS